MALLGWIPYGLGSGGDDLFHLYHLGHFFLDHFGSAFDNDRFLYCLHDDLGDDFFNLDSLYNDLGLGRRAAGRQQYEYHQQDTDKQSGSFHFSSLLIFFRKVMVSDASDLVLGVYLLSSLLPQPSEDQIVQQEEFTAGTFNPGRTESYPDLCLANAQVFADEPGLMPRG